MEYTWEPYLPIAAETNNYYATKPKARTQSSFSRMLLLETLSRGYITSIASSSLCLASPDSKSVEEFREETKECLIGEGASAKVFKGTWKKENGQVINVALKRMHLQVDSSSNKQTTCLEVLTGYCNAELLLRAERLNHRNLMKVFGACVTNKFLIFVARYANDTLGKILKGSNFSWRKKLQFVRHIAEGMAVLHTACIIHRDLKCDNILFQLISAKRGYCCVADFGCLSKFEASSPPDHKGTPLFAAPETFLPNPKDGFATDVWSFGMVLYEILTDRFPWVKTGEIDPNKNKEVLQRITDLMNEGTRPHIPKVWFPKGYGTLMERCWDQCPHQRPSFREISEELKKITSQELSGVWKFTDTVKGNEFQILLIQQGNALSGHSGDRKTKYCGHIHETGLQLTLKVDIPSEIQNLIDGKETKIPNKIQAPAGWEMEVQKDGTWEEKEGSLKMSCQSSIPEEEVASTITTGKSLDRFGRHLYAGLYQGEKVFVLRLDDGKYAGLKMSQIVLQTPQLLPYYAEIYHPNLALLKCINVDKNVLSIVTESSLENTNLYSYISSHSLSWRTRLQIALNLADLLNTFHQQGIILRSLSCMNILIREDKTFMVRDFTYALPVSHLDTGEYQEQQDAGGSIMIGKMYQNAPETWEKHLYSKKTDVYSFGLILYLLATQEEYHPPELDLPKTVPKRMSEKKQKKKQESNNIIGPDDEKGVMRDPFLVPHFPSHPDAYRKLTKRCLAKIPGERPCFASIINQLSQIRI
jgi:serine/threonine protein kinase